MKKFFTAVLCGWLCGCVTPDTWVPESVLGMYGKERQAQIAAYVERNPSLPDRIKEVALKDDICVGMPSDTVYFLRGSPSRVNTSVGSYGKHEQWVYDNWGTGNESKAYLYFRNGTLTSWQFSSGRY